MSVRLWKKMFSSHFFSFVDKANKQPNIHSFICIARLKCDTAHCRINTTAFGMLHIPPHKIHRIRLYVCVYYIYIYIHRLCVYLRIYIHEFLYIIYYIYLCLYYAGLRDVVTYILIVAPSGFWLLILTPSGFWQQNLITIPTSPPGSD